MRKIIFTVDRLEFVGEGKFMVGGISHGSEIKVGDSVKLHDSAVEYENNLIIEKIQLYREQVECLPSGMSGALYFSNLHAKYFNLGAKLVGEIT